MSVQTPAPCRRCGGPKPPGQGRQTCDACQATKLPRKQCHVRLPCKRCGGDKGAGRSRHYCTACEAVKRDEWAANRKARNALIDRDTCRRYESAWRARNPEYHAIKSQRRRDAFVEYVSALVVLERDDGVCGICGGDVDPFDFHVDHVVPLARGGEHGYSNVQTAHPICNMRKGATL